MRCLLSAIGNGGFKMLQGPGRSQTAQLLPLRQPPFFQGPLPDAGPSGLRRW